jgi:hypothetical protein
LLILAASTNIENGSYFYSLKGYYYYYLRSSAVSLKRNMEGLLAAITNATLASMSTAAGSVNLGDDNHHRSTTTMTTAVTAAINASSSSVGSSGELTQLDRSIIERFASNRRVTNEAAFIGLITAYCVLIVVGTIGNSLVVYVVAMQPAMRTARNVFVVNLAVSDLLLCLITMPLTVSARTLLPSQLNARSVSVIIFLQYHMLQCPVLATHALVVVL